MPPPTLSAPQRWGVRPHGAGDGREQRHRAGGGGVARQGTRCSACRSQQVRLGAGSIIRDLVEEEEEEEEEGEIADAGNSKRKRRRTVAEALAAIEGRAAALSASTSRAS